MVRFCIFVSVLFLVHIIVPSSILGAGDLEKSIDISKIIGGKVFRSGDGVRVEMALIAPEKGIKRVLVRAENLGSEWDHKILLHRIIEYDGNADFVMEYLGRDWITIAQRRYNGWDAFQKISFELPGSKKSLVLIYDRKDSDAFHPEDLAKAYSKPATVEGKKL